MSVISASVKDALNEMGVFMGTGSVRFAVITPTTGAALATLVYVNLSPATTADVPPAVVTVTSTIPAEPGGEVAVI